MANIRGSVDKALYGLTMEHLAKLSDYVPGPVKKAGGTVEKLMQRYRKDPLFSVFGLDSKEYVAATLAGGTITSIHRKIGDIYEGCVREVFHQTLGLSVEQLTYSATIRSGDNEEARTLDVFIGFSAVADRKRRAAIRKFGRAELRALASRPQLRLIGIGMEVRHCYQTGDSKRTQADEAMARHLLVSGVLPIMPLFCNQSNPTIVRRYRSVWVVKEGMTSYDMVQSLSGYDLYDFMRRNSGDFRKPVIEMLKGLSV